MALQDRPRAFGKSDRVYEEAPEGTFGMTLVKVVDMGVQPNKYYDKNKPEGWDNQPTKRDVRLGWLIPVPMSDGQPFMVSQFMSLKVTLSRKAVNRSALTKLAEMLLGKTIWEIDKEVDAKDEIDIARALLGHSAMGVVKRAPGGRSKVSSVAPMPRDAAGNPLLPLPDVGTQLDDVKVLPRTEPVAGPAEMEQVRKAAETRAAEIGAGPREVIEWAKAELGVVMVNTMPISKVPALLEEIKRAEPPNVSGEEPLPF